MPATLKSNLAKIARQADRRASRAVRETVVDIQTGAAIRSRVRTGEMRGGWHAEMLDNHQGVVRNAVEHTRFNEEGTHNRDGSVRMTGQPMLGPAVEEARPKFVAKMRGLYR